MLLVSSICFQSWTQTNFKINLETEGVMAETLQHSRQPTIGPPNNCSFILAIIKPRHEGAALSIKQRVSWAFYLQLQQQNCFPVLNVEQSIWIKTNHLSMLWRTAIGTSDWTTLFLGKSFRFPTRQACHWKRRVTTWKVLFAFNGSSLFIWMAFLHHNQISSSGSEAHAAP